MCGGCNIWAESAGASVIAARYWWVARQGRRAVAEAEVVARDAATLPVAQPDVALEELFVGEQTPTLEASVSGRHT